MVISWSDYLLTALLVLAFYYAAILLIYYRKNIKHKLLPAKKTAAKPPIDSALFSPVQKQDGDKLDAASAAPMHSLVDELQAYVSQSGKEEITKEDLADGIKTLLQKYPDISDSIFKEGITNLIAVIAENNCAIHFSADELNELWKT